MCIRDRYVGARFRFGQTSLGSRYVGACELYCAVRVRNRQYVRLGQERCQIIRCVRALGKCNGQHCPLVVERKHRVIQFQLREPPLGHVLQPVCRFFCHSVHTFRQRDGKGQRAGGGLRRCDGVAACGECCGKQQNGGQQAAQNAFFQGRFPLFGSDSIVRSQDRNCQAKARFQFRYNTCFPFISGPSVQTVCTAIWFP